MHCCEACVGFREAGKEIESCRLVLACSDVADEDAFVVVD